jgi:lipoprotein-anchoring transpeptidase ErfK/SrfK
MWHGMRIQSLDPVPVQFQRAHAAATRGSIARTASATLTVPTTTTTTPTTTTTSTTTTTTTTSPTKTTVILSNERTFTRWAYTNQIVWIRTQPSVGAKRIVRTNWYTPDGFPELYLALKESYDAQGHPWVRIRIPGRPNGRVGWVPRRALGTFHLTHELVVVNREKTRMFLFVKGRRVWSAPVGVGKRSTPTPAGHFWIRERFRVTTRNSGYYPFAFGTTDYSTLSNWPGGGVVGIHGPYYDPSGIPGHISHGCIRLEVKADAYLAHHVTLGVPVHVI